MLFTALDQALLVSEMRKRRQLPAEDIIARQLIQNMLDAVEQRSPVGRVSAKAGAESEEL